MQRGYVATQPNIPQLAQPNQQWSPPDYAVILTLNFFKQYGYYGNSF